MTKTTGSDHLRLATRNGKSVDESRDSLPPLDRYVSEAKLPIAERLDLPSTTLGNLAVPHADRFPADTERVGETLMSSAEVVENVLERDFGLCGLGHGRRRAAVSDAARSVSTLPVSVKRLTPRPVSRTGKLVYVGSKKRTKDPWAIERGKVMRAAREALGKSQKAIADLAEIQDRETISQYESGQIADIPTHIIPKLVTALGVHPQELSREKWEGADGARDLRVSTVALQIAYSFDKYPIAIQNQIRESITRYEIAVKQLGKERASQLYGPMLHEHRQPPGPAEHAPKKRRTG